VKEQFQISNAAKGKTATMTITGYISPWNRNAGAEIRKNFAELESKYDNINIDIVNCYGGSIFEGWPTFNAIRDSRKNVKTLAEGLVASMGSILYLAPAKKENRLSAKGSRLMIHKASGGAVGDHETLTEQAEVMKSMELELIEVVAEATGKEVKTVTADWFKRGVDKYFSPQQAVDAGLAGSIKNSKKVKTPPPEDVMNAGSQETLANFYNAQFNEPTTDNQIKNKMEKLPLFIAALTSCGVEISNEATETEILNKVQELSKTNIAIDAKLKAVEIENAALKTAAETQTKAAVKSLIDNAVKSGRIKEDQRESMTNYANTDLSGATEFINGLAEIRSFSKDGGGSNGKPKDKKDPENRAEWTLNTWRKKDPKGLGEMKKKEPENYQALVDALADK